LHGEQGWGKYEVLFWCQTDPKRLHTLKKAEVEFGLKDHLISSGYPV
jgi:hypothetical protein